jgi:hypothetical protein
MPNSAAVDAEVSKIMTDTHAEGWLLRSSITARPAMSRPTASATPREIR